MKLVDSQGNEVTSKNNEKAQELEQQLAQKAEKIVEPIFNKLKLANQQIPQDQLLQLTSMAHQILFNRLVFNLIQKVGVENIDDLITEDDLEELKTSFNNQIQFSEQSQTGAPGGGGETPQA